MKRLLGILLLVVSPAVAQSRRVIYVDNTRSGGNGTYESPYATLRQAQTVSGPADIIFVAQGSGPYEEGLALQRGQMLIGSAFGLDAARVELHADFSTPSVPASTGTGPVIHGAIALAGDNVVAGCTVVADRKISVAISASAPQGPLTLRMMNLRSSSDAWALYVDSSTFPVTWTGGRLDATDHGSGILLNGGDGDVTLDHVAIAGEFATAIAVRGRSGGTVAFRNAPISIDDASRDAVTLAMSRGAVRFESPVQMKTNGGRGLVVDRVEHLSLAAGGSSIETVNAPALEIRDSGADLVLQSLSARGVAPGRLPYGLVVDKLRGRLEINGDSGKPGSGGTIANADSYGARLVQSASIHLRNMAFTGGGTVPAKEECPQDIATETNLRCRAAIYLRHLEESSFENISVDGSGGVGINTNNLAGVSFSDVRVTQTGDLTSEPALLINETRGSLSFVRCSFIDGAGGGVAIEQRFSRAAITFDRCEFAAPNRPMAAAHVVRARVSGSAKLSLAIINSQIHDNAGGGIAIDAADTAAARLVLTDSDFRRLGATAVRVNAQDRASGCIDASGNDLPGGAPAFKIKAPSLRIAGESAEPTASWLSRRNGGAAVVLDVPSLTAASTCP